MWRSTQIYDKKKTAKLTTRIDDKQSNVKKRMTANNINVTKMMIKTAKLKKQIIWWPKTIDDKDN